jgi:hypothetical protein
MSNVRRFMSILRACEICDGELEAHPNDEDQLVCSLCKCTFEVEDIPDSERFVGPQGWGLVTLRLDRTTPNYLNLRSDIEACWRRCEKFTPLRSFRNQVEGQDSWNRDAVEMYAPISAYLRMRRALVQRGCAETLISYLPMNKDAIPFPLGRPESA